VQNSFSSRNPKSLPLNISLPPRFPL